MASLVLVSTGQTPGAPWHVGSKQGALPFASALLVTCPVTGVRFRILPLKRALRRSGIFCDVRFFPFLVDLLKRACCHVDYEADIDHGVPCCLAHMRLAHMQVSMRGLMSYFC